jgi:hypothetical protein
MKEQIENLVNLFLIQLPDIYADNDELNKLNTIRGLSAKTSEEIMVLLESREFNSEQEEIDFFKLLNPKVLTPLIEQGLKYTILINKPIDTNEALIGYFENALKTLQSFFSMNNFHYQYFKNNFMELDRIYFKRNAGPPTIPVSEIPVQGNQYYPPMSYLFAKFLAYENIQHYLLNEIDSLKILPSIDKSHIDSEHHTEIRWTGDAINVVELAYGLWLTGQLNNGNASLNQIVRWLENNLSVSIGIAQRKFSEISRRKRISVTKFIDQMQEAILKKIESDYE